MRDLAITLLIAFGALLVLAVALVVAIAWACVEIDMTLDDIVDAEIRDRTLDDYRNDEGRSDMTVRDGQKSRIGEYAPTTNNTRSMWD